MHRSLVVCAVTLTVHVKHIGVAEERQARQSHLVLPTQRKYVRLAQLYFTAQGHLVIACM